MLTALYVDHRVRWPANYSKGITVNNSEEDELVAHNLGVLLEFFTSVTSVSNGNDLLKTLKDIEGPTVAFIDVPDFQSRSNELYGKLLLKHVASVFSFSTVLPIALVQDEDNDPDALLHTGAADVINYSINPHRIKSLKSVFYSISRRTPRWVSKYNSHHIDNIFISTFFDMYPCNTPHQIPPITDQRSSYLRDLVRLWDFPVNILTDDELFHAAFFIFKDTFTLPGISQFVISDDKLFNFLFTVRGSYVPSNPYHNFRHAVDVLQATYFFFLSMGKLPSIHNLEQDYKSSLSRIIEPADVLTLLVTAIGHDVGHPGVSNAFLIAVRSPIAQIYSDKSVLESFHSATLLQILKDKWPVLVQDNEIKITITEAVLATDMGVHFEYMKRLDRMKRYGLENTDRGKRLLCSTLIKCADVSNVARELEISTHWGQVLTEEFKIMADLEVKAGLKPAPENGPTSQAPNKQKEINDLAKSQILFIDSFALPLFTAVSKVIPELTYTTTYMAQNREVWSSRLA
ncbi:hypothetical protein V1514DRAFT_334673 [Lipomyces japonicus]|uniref:uncharacterized protein n=1 Tax=Lipomyces japonicus TaxID=56871 RepID=UPI0034D00C4A